MRGLSLDGPSSSFQEPSFCARARDHLPYPKALADGGDLYSDGSPRINSLCRGLLCRRTSCFSVGFDWHHNPLGQLDFDFEPGHGDWAHIVAVVVRVSDAQLFELRKPVRDECVTGRGRQRHRVASDCACDRHPSNREGTDEAERCQSMSESHVSLMRLEAIEDTLTHRAGGQLSSTWHLPMKRLRCWRVGHASDSNGAALTGAAWTIRCHGKGCDYPAGPIENDRCTESGTSGRGVRYRRSAFSFDRFQGAHLNAQERASGHFAQSRLPGGVWDDGLVSRLDPYAINRRWRSRTGRHRSEMSAPGTYRPGA
jgi:hypothetical protein